MKIVHTGWPRILGLIVPYCFALLLFQYLIGQIAGIDLFDFEADQTTERRFYIIFGSMLATILTVWIFVRFVDKERFVSIGFSTKNRGKEFLMGLGLGTVVMVTGFLLLFFLDEIQFHQINWDLREFLFLALMFIFVAISEEVLFRGYILKNFMLSFPPYFALIISSLIFSLMHGFNPNFDFIGFTNLFLAGVLLGLPYLYTRNLWFPIALHFSWNFFQSLLGFNVSGSSSYSLVQFNLAKDSLLNGGAFGFEGSILAILAHLIAIVFIGIYFHRKYPLQVQAAVHVK